MGFLKSIDWQLAGFVAGSLVQEYLGMRLPRIYYFRVY
jgi:hypothetical protein